MGWSSFFVLLCVLWTFFILGTHELQSSQTQVLLQLRKHLEYPKQLEIWYDSHADFCYLSTGQVNITCQDNSVTELRIVGDKSAKVSNFSGFAIPYQTLSQNFSMDSFVATLSRLTSLRVLRLVSLGIWGPLPAKIHRLYSLEYLDLGSNFLFGSVPPEICRLVKLQTLTLEGNFFSGTVPNCFDSLSNLTNLSLRNNRLSGALPSSIQRLNTLTNLTLSDNEISGKLPELSSLTSLRVLDLSDNKLGSELPIMPKGLVMASLSNNSFSGRIPRQYSQLGQLQHLDLSFNALGGTVPAALLSLPNMNYLNLASNMLSGSIPSHLSCGGALGLVDLSNNRLNGRLPPCLATKSDKRIVKFNGNCLLSDPSLQQPESYCAEEVRMKRNESKGKNVGILLGVIGGIFVVIVLLAFGFLVLCRRYCPRGISEQHLLRKSVQDNSVTGFSTEVLTNARSIAQATKLGTQGVPVHQLFSLEELKEATKGNISTLLGEGSYGKLYRGRLENGTQVAIRCLTVSKRYTIRNLKLRLDLLARLRHPHLVCLLGHCIAGGEQDGFGAKTVYLVYEYVSTGNYHSHLTENSPEQALRWSDRLAVLIGVAKAVHFLHTGIIPGFFNNRLKANNVLLSEHWMAKLSDYGLSIIAEEIDKHEEKDGLKSWQMKCLDDDVYSFGFILLESLVGPSASARREAFLLNEMVSFGSRDSQERAVDPVVLASCSQESLSIVISIMNKCISPESLSRPSFEDVLWNLQYAAQVQATAEGDPRFETVPRS